MDRKNAGEEKRSGEREKNFPPPASLVTETISIARRREEREGKREKTRREGERRRERGERGKDERRELHSLTCEERDRGRKEKRKRGGDSPRDRNFRRERREDKI